MCASEVRFVPGSYVEADHVNGRPHSFYVKSLKASGVNQAFCTRMKLWSHLRKDLQITFYLLILIRESERFILMFRYCNIVKINVLKTILATFALAVICLRN